jgi:hypothetical protein
VQLEWKGLHGLVDVITTDIHGKPVLSQQVQSPLSGIYSGIINLYGQPKGIYIVKLVTGDQVVIRKVLLQ